MRVEPVCRDKSIEYGVNGGGVRKTYSGVTLDERIVVLEEETDLNGSWKQGTRLKKPAGDFNMLMLGKEIVCDKVNGYSIDSGKDAPMLREMQV